MVIQKFLAFLELQKFLGNICSFEQLFYRKELLGAPVKTSGGSRPRDTGGATIQTLR